MNPLRPRMPPFGIAYIASMLKPLNIKCNLHDDNLLEYTDAQLKELFLGKKDEIEVVGLTSISVTFNQLKRVAKISKEALPNIPIIVGGPHARLLPEEIINVPEIDIVFTSEAEKSIVDFAKGIDKAQIPDIIYKENGIIKKSNRNDYFENLDEIPFPDYGLFNISDYHATKGLAKRHPTSYIITSRGCPYHCTFCSSRDLNPTHKKTVRYRSPENVLEEINLLVKKHGVREIFFSDDLFTANNAHLMNICEGMIRAKLDLIWVCMGHVNTVNPEKLKIMKKAGCHNICYGVESGDPVIQKTINKNLDFQKVKEVVKMTQKAGIAARCSYMFGNHTETPATMQRTIDLAIKLKSDYASFNIATPYPGTYLRQWAVENKYLVDDSYESLDSSVYTIVTPELPAGTVEQYCNKAFKKFYFRLGYILQRLMNIRTKDDILLYLKSIFYAIRSCLQSIVPKKKNQG